MHLSENVAAEEMDERDWSDVFGPLDNKTRYSMLLTLKEKGPMSHKELAKEFDLSKKDYEFQLRRLQDGQLIKLDYMGDGNFDESHICVTPKASSILDYLSKEDQKNA